MGLLQILSGSGALALAAIGIAMTGRNEFTAAYWLFWAAGITATIAGLWYELTSLDPAPLRYGSGFVAGIAVFVVLPMLFRWLHRQKMKAGVLPPDTSSGQ